MKVLLFTTSDLSVGGGSAIRGRLLALGLRRLGASVSVVALGAPQNFADHGLEFTALGPDYRQTLLAVARRKRPDVIYGITEGGADAVAAVASATATPAVYDMHGIGVVEILELGPGFGSRKTRLANSVRWLWAIHQGAAITVANPTLVPFAKLLNPHSVLLPGAVDLHHFRPDGPSRSLGNGNKIEVLYAGNFLKWQGATMLLEAAEQREVQQSFHITMVGSFGREQAGLGRFQDLVQEGVVTLRDSVSYEEVPALLRSADILVIPRPLMLSTYLAFPNKIVDYMASGRAVLATDIAPHRYAIRDGVTGILCGPNPSGIAHGLLRLRDKGLRERLGRSARVKAEQEFSAERVGTGVLTTLVRVVERASGSPRRLADSSPRPFPSM